MNNPEKLATYGTLDEEKQNKNTTQYAEKQQIPILKSGLNRPGFEPRSPACEASTLTITPLMQFILF